MTKAGTKARGAKRISNFVIHSSLGISTIVISNVCHGKIVGLVNNPGNKKTRGIAARGLGFSGY